MDKLNKLVELAKKATPGEWWIDSHGHSMVAFYGNEMEVVFVTEYEAMGEAKRHEDTGNLSHWRNDNDATFIESANPQAILAIAEAFRDLEQRAEAAAAKLAGLEKQKAIFQVEVSGNHWLNAGPVDDSDFTGLPDGVNLLYARPAPAADLADLVPGNDLLRVLDFAKFVIKCVRKNGEYAPLSSQEPDEIDAILRKIEEAR